MKPYLERLNFYLGKAVEQLRQRRALRILLYVFMFLGSFIFFFYLTFPYGVLKEAIAAEISKSSGYIITVKHMGPSLPLGVELKDLTIQSPGGGDALVFERARAHISIFSLLFGGLRLNADLSQGPKDDLDLSVRFSLFDLLRGHSIPTDIRVNARNFPLNDPVHFLLSSMATSPTTNPLLAPVLLKISFVGKLNADADLDLGGNDASGTIDIKFADSVLSVKDQSLHLPAQKFSKAQIRARLNNGTLSFDESSGLNASELSVVPRGKINLKNTADPSFEMSIAVALDKELRSSFGFLIDAFSGGSHDGNVTLQLRGPMSRLAVNAL